MLDSNVLSALLNQPDGRVAQRAAAAPRGALCTSVICAFELTFGSQKKGSAKLASRVAQLLTATPVLPLAFATAEHYADIRLGLQKAGTPIGSNDLLIAAHARSLGLTLVTHNLREFQRVPGLVVEDWLV